MKEELKAFDRLLKIMDDLRQSCPWDKEQTLESLRYLTIEEVYELSDDILSGNMEGIKGELGDLFLHLVFYSKIAAEKKAFDVTDVLNAICEKLILRHPHIYSDTQVTGSKEVKENWERIKMKEGRTSVLQGVPKSLPAMVKAYRVQEKVKGVGFDWEKPHQVWDKVNEEMEELQHEVKALNSPQKIEGEFGDLLFALINYARFIGVNPEDALERTNQKFIKRFQFLEQKTKEDGKVISEMSLEQMDVYWERAKKEE